jgi:predicted  nucleic acid-binding Zn-ribbon protein
MFGMMHAVRRQPAIAVERRRSKDRRKTQRLTLSTLNQDIEACSRHVDRLEKTVKVMALEIASLRDRIRS